MNGEAPTPQQDGRVHVLMMVGNDVTTDSRVKKEALALADGGARVTVLGVALDGVRSFERLGDALIVRVPVQFRLRDERNRRRRVRRNRRPPLLGYKSRAEHIARAARVRARLEDVKAESGWAIGNRRGGLGELTFRFGVVGRKLRYAYWKGVGRGVKLRAGTGHHVADGLAQGWRAWDGVVSRMPWPARWRAVLPEADDYEAVFGKVIDQLAPDAVHAHDMHLIGVAARAAGRARLRGRDLKVVYDAHEFVAGMARYGGRTPKFVAAWANHEREYVGRADRVVTVSPALATALAERYHLDREPTVILNTPLIEPLTGDPVSVRVRAGLSEDTPLVVYSGGLTPARGVGLVIDSLRHLPGVHLAIVCVPNTSGSYVQVLREQAEAGGVAAQVHFVNPVHTSQVVQFLGSADVGVHPLTAGARNHDVALPNKLFEYIHAGIPLVVTDLQSLGAFVRQWRVGEPFRPGDAADLARQVRAVLDGKERYRAATRDPELLAEISWERQADALRALYSDLLGTTIAVAKPEPEGPSALAAMPSGIPAPGAAAPVVAAPARVRARHVIIGPSNSAGQAWHWARAIERYHPSVAAESLMVENNDFGFASDVVVSSEDFRTDFAWMVRYARHMLDTSTHVIFETGRPLAGQPGGTFFDIDLPSLRSAGIHAGAVFHGSEIRNPRQHRETYRYSPFAAADDEHVARLQRVVDVLMPIVDAFDGAKFVSTPDLLDFVPGSVWLPIVVDADAMASDRPVLETPRPVVVHAPSNSALKGSSYVDPVLQSLHDRGLVEYRRIEGVPHDELMSIMRTADIVVDQLLIGSYGVFACEAMAAGRVTVGHVADHVRDQLPMPLPLVEATPDDFAEVIERIVSERDESVKAAAAGPDFVRSLHDGRAAAEALAPFLAAER